MQNLLGSLLPVGERSAVLGKVYCEKASFFNRFSQKNVCFVLLHWWQCRYWAASGQYNAAQPLLSWYREMSTCLILQLRKTTHFFIPGVNSELTSEISQHLLRLTGQRLGWYFKFSVLPADIHNVIRTYNLASIISPAASVFSTWPTQIESCCRISLWCSAAHSLPSLQLLRNFSSPDVILCGWLGSKHQLTD